MHICILVWIIYFGFANSFLSWLTICITQAEVFVFLADWPYPRELKSISSALIIYWVSEKGLAEACGRNTREQDESLKPLPAPY